MIGLGVMINALGGDAHSGFALLASQVGEEITNAEMENDELHLAFRSGVRLKLYDAGQSCCESRWMHTDDNPDDLVGKKFSDLVLKAVDSTSDAYSEHEIQFVELRAEDVYVTFACHNEHNGYYGGFYVKVEKC